MAPVLFNIQDSLLHIEALAMDVSPRLINIEPTLIRFQARPLLRSACEYLHAVGDVPGHAVERLTVQDLLAVSLGLPWLLSPRPAPGPHGAWRLNPKP